MQMALSLGRRRVFASKEGEPWRRESYSRLLPYSGSRSRLSTGTRMRMGTCLGSGFGADPGAQIRIRVRVKDSRMEEDRLWSPDRVRIRTAGGRRQARLRIQPAWADPFLLLFVCFCFTNELSSRRRRDARAGYGRTDRRAGTGEVLLSL